MATPTNWCPSSRAADFLPPPTSPRFSSGPPAGATTTYQHWNMWSIWIGFWANCRRVGYPQWQPDLKQLDRVIDTVRAAHAAQRSKRFLRQEGSVAKTAYSAALRARLGLAILIRTGELARVAREVSKTAT